MNNKYLTILAGSPRGGERTWQSLYSNLLEPLNSDLAICTGTKWLENQSFLENAKYSWIIEEPENWFNYYEDNFTGTWKEYFNLGKETGLYNSGSIHFALKDIILKNYINDVMNYEFIIYTRFDQFYLDKHPEFSGKKIWIPEGEDYFGICDRHAVVPVEQIAEYLNICKYINSEEALLSNSNHLNCEVTYKNFLTNSKLIEIVDRFKRTQFTTALKSDPTNWRIPKYKLYFFNKLMLKYPDEFIDSFKSLNVKRKLSIVLSDSFLLYVNYLYLLLRRTLGRMKKKSE